MWEGWKNIECFIYLFDEIPYSTDTTYSFDGWIALSKYGIMRGRPQITGSSRSGSAITIPGRNGSTYPSDATRDNAKVSIELLVANAWTHKNSSFTAIERADQLVTMAMRTKYFAFKEPGRNLDSYFIVRDTSATISDSDENALAVKLDFEVHPVRYWISGLLAFPIGPADNGKTVYNNFPYVIGEGNDIITEWRCGTDFYTPPDGEPNPYLHYERNGEIIRPTFIIENGGTVDISIFLNSESGSMTKVTEIKAKSLENFTILDTNRCLAWTYINNEVANRNSKFSGDYTLLWTPVGRKARYHASNNTSQVKMYTNEGMLL